MKLSYYSWLTRGSFLLLALLLQFPTWAQCQIDKTGWVLDSNVSDEFDGASLNTAKWSINIDFNNSPPSLNTPDNVSVGNGMLTLTSRKLPAPATYQGTSYNYTIAGIRSTYKDFPEASGTGLMYGMYEIRCKLPKSTGVMPAFWLSSPNAPDYWETDVFEYPTISPNNFFCTTHWEDPDSRALNASNYYQFPFDITSDFHTWTLVWTPTKLTWFFDGRELQSDNTLAHIPGAPGSKFNSSLDAGQTILYQKMDLLISSSMKGETNETVFDPYVVDYVRVYRPAAVSNHQPGQYPNGQTWTEYLHNTLVPAYSLPYKSMGNSWLLYSADGASGYNVASNLQVTQSGGKFYYRNGNQLWTTYYYDYGGGGRYYTAQLSSSEVVTGDVAVNQTESIIAFNSNGTLRYYENGTFHGSNITNIASNLRIAEDGLHVFYKGTDGQLYGASRSQNSDTWFFYAVNASANAVGNLVLDPVGSDGVYFHDLNGRLLKGFIHSTSYAISEPNRYDVAGSLVVSADGNIVYYRTTSNGIAYYQYTGNAWQRHEVQAQYYGASTATALNNVVGDIQVNAAGNQFYYLDNTQHVCVVYYSNGQWYAVALDPLVNYVAKDLVLGKGANNTDGYLCFVGTDGKIRFFHWGGCEVLNPTPSTTTYYRTSSPAAAVPSAPAAFPLTTTVQLFPNPVQHMLTVDASVLSERVTEVAIYSAQMQLVRSQAVSANFFALDMHELPAGLYYLRLKTQQGIKYLKFAKE